MGTTTGILMKQMPLVETFRFFCANCHQKFQGMLKKKKRKKGHAMVLPLSDGSSLIQDPINDQLQIILITTDWR